MKDIKTDICENRQKAANAWKNVMKGPPTAPVCKGGIISEGLFNLVPFSKKKWTKSVITVPRLFNLKKANSV